MCKRPVGRIPDITRGFVAVITMLCSSVCSSKRYVQLFESILRCDFRAHVSPCPLDAFYDVIIAGERARKRGREIASRAAHRLREPAPVELFNALWVREDVDNLIGCRHVTA